MLFFLAEFIVSVSIDHHQSRTLCGGTTFFINRNIIHSCENYIYHNLTHFNDNWLVSLQNTY